MIATALLAASLVAPQQDSTPYSQAQMVAEPSRLALTPTLDGVIAKDEWDEFSRGADTETYLQWEPGKLYVAAKMPVDKDLVVSLDGKRNGWLVGRDNIEIRVREKDGKPSIEVRQLDATNVAGPTWINLKGYLEAGKVASKTVDGVTTVEAMISDPGIDLMSLKEGQKFLARMDVVAQTSQQTEPFYPRLGSEIKLSMQRASAIPMGLNWNVEEPGRTVTPGRSSKIRFTFNAKEDLGLKKMEIKAAGPVGDQTATLGVPFPIFDKKGRAFVDYEAKTAKDAPSGYHLLNGTLMTSDGAPAVIQASFRIAPLVDYSLASDRIKVKDPVRTVKIPFFIKSNSINRLDGTCDVEAPAGWEIDKGDDKGFIIYNARAGVRRVLTVTLPAGVAGTYPLKFKSKIGDKVIEDVCWLTVTAG